MKQKKALILFGYVVKCLLNLTSSGDKDSFNFMKVI